MLKWLHFHELWNGLAVANAHCERAAGPMPGSAFRHSSKGSPLKAQSTLPSVSKMRQFLTRLRRVALLATSLLAGGAYADAYGMTSYLPDTGANTDVWPLGGEQHNDVAVSKCLELARRGGYHFANFMKANGAVGRCNLYRQDTTAALGGVSYNTDWDLYAVN